MVDRANHCRPLLGTQHGGACIRLPPDRDGACVSGSVRNLGLAARGAEARHRYRSHPGDPRPRCDSGGQDGPVLRPSQHDHWEQCIYTLIRFPPPLGLSGRYPLPVVRKLEDRGSPIRTQYPGRLCDQWTAITWSCRQCDCTVPETEAGRLLVTTNRSLRPDRSLCQPGDLLLLPTFSLPTDLDLGLAARSVRLRLPDDELCYPASSRLGDDRRRLVPADLQVPLAAWLHLDPIRRSNAMDGVLDPSLSDYREWTADHTRGFSRRPLPSDWGPYAPAVCHVPHELRISAVPR